MSIPFDLTGRTALVTGGGRGLGAGITRAMLDAGADVIVFGRSELPSDLREYAIERGRALDLYSVDLGEGQGIAEVSAAVLAERQVADPKRPALPGAVTCPETVQLAAPTALAKACASASPTCPVTAIPALFWKACTAASVEAPKLDCPISSAEML